MKRVTNAVACVLTIVLGSNAAWANPYFAKQTGRECEACHLPRQELRGADGLNGFGIAFMNNNHNIVVPHATSTEFGAGTVRLAENCNGNSRQLRLWLAGRADNEVTIRLDYGASIHITVPQGTTYSGACGRQHVAEPNAFLSLE